jgi:Tat protein translocase TatC
MWQGILNKVFKIREKVALNLSKEDEEKPFLEHLDDLRTMLVRIFTTLIIAVIATFVFNQQLLQIIMIPYKWGMEMAEEARKEMEAAEKKDAPKTEAVKTDADTPAPAPTTAAAPESGTTIINIHFWVPGSNAPLVQTQTSPSTAATVPAETPKPAPPAISPEAESLMERLNRIANTYEMPGTRTPQEGFMVCVNVALIAAVILSFPLLLLFLLQFILPGLRDNEKKTLFPALAIGFGLFLTGVCFSYFAVLPRALGFFAEWNHQHGIKNTWMLGDYVTFATRFVLIFGVSFELPVVVMALVKLDFLGYKVMKTTRKHAIIAIAVFSAIITPTQDVLTLLLLAGPLYVLYEMCIWLAYFMEKKERQLYPEFYAERDKDEAELSKETTDDWDKEDYNPWGSSDDDDEDPDAWRRKEDAPAKATEKTDPSVNDGPTDTASEETSGEPSAERERQQSDQPLTDEERAEQDRQSKRNED